jgi:hypothetical protein
MNERFVSITMYHNVTEGCTKDGNYYIRIPVIAMSTKYAMYVNVLVLYCSYGSGDAAARGLHYD